MTTAIGYNGQWTVTLDFPDALAPAELDALDTETGYAPPPTVGNGKLAIVPSFSCLAGATSVLITTDTAHGSGGNAHPTFNAFGVSFPDADAGTGAFAQAQQSLDMRNAVFNSVATMTVHGGKALTLGTDIYAPGQLPFCAVRTLRITPAVDIDALVLHHEVVCPDVLAVPGYNNNVYYSGSGAAAGSYMTTGESKNAAGKTFAFASTCIFDPVDAAVNLGFNVYDNRPRECFNAFSLRDLAAGTTYRVHVVTVAMTSDDFDAPLDECKRIALYCYTVGIDNIRTAHIRYWTALWTSSEVAITPKVGISLADEAEMSALRRNVRLAQYTLYSACRETVHIGETVQNFGVCDPDGVVLASGDIFLLPLLLLLKPALARSVLDFCFATLPAAKRLAAGYGFVGAKYPYRNEQVGYKNSLYWKTAGNALALFNTALVSINVWNYYRASRDRDCLQNVGYPVLRENAHFFASTVVETGVRTYAIEGVLGLGGIESARNNAFTNGAVKLALRAAAEATYELAYTVDASWVEYMYWLPLPLGEAAFSEVYKIDDAFDVATPGGPAPPVEEALFLFLPCYSLREITAVQNENVTYSGVVGPTAIKANMDAYAALVPSSGANPENALIDRVLRCCLTAQYAQSDPAYVADFRTQLGALIDANLRGRWSNDAGLTFAASLLFVVVQGVAQRTLKGGVAETRFYYDEMRTQALVSANMPNAWKDVRVCGGVTTNVLYYV
ncbi:hypothetical protein FOA52_007625 [Chlamydomonas sp. UWO 241]|nr:hypothetical protein FOA52_007625 [Chlamydomonas sp. UWO 241]